MTDVVERLNMIINRSDIPEDVQLELIDIAEEVGMYDRLPLSLSARQMSFDDYE